MTEAARAILESVSSEGYESMTDDTMRRTLWGLAKILPLILDRLDELKRHDAEQDEYMLVFKVSWCALRFLGENKKYAVALAFLVINAMWSFSYIWGFFR